MRIRLFVNRTAIAVLLAGGLVGVGGGEESSTSPLPSLSPVVKADRMESLSNDWFRAEGHVKVLYADHELRADEVDLNQKSGDVHARGHVELVREGTGKWAGEKLDYNYVTKEGMTGASEAAAGRFTVTARETSRDPDGTIHLRHARISTCTNDVDHWHYWIAGEKIDYREKDRVTIRDATPCFMGVPFFYMPYATRDLNHPFGPRLVPGYRSSWGPYLLTTYTHTLYDPPGPDELDGNVMLDYRLRHGLAYGYEVDWTHELLGRGLFGVYAANDTHPNGSDNLNTNRVGNQRYRFYVRHQADPTPADQVLLQGDYLSDVRMMEDFFPDLYREQSQPDNFIAYTHRGITYASGVEVAGPLNDFYDGVGRLPEGWLTVMPQELFPETGLYYESESRAGYLAQQWAREKSLAIEPFEPETTRVHTLQKLTYPLHFYDNALSVVPRAAYDYTFYTHPEVDRTNETRSVFEAGVEASTRAYATYGNYRHVFEPYIDYALITRPLNWHSGTNVFFDRVDGPREWRDQFGIDGRYEPRQWNGIRPGMRNEVQTRDGSGNTRTLFDWDTFAACRFGGGTDSNDASGLRLAGWDGTYRPFRGLRVASGGYYDVKQHRVDTSDSSIAIGEGGRTELELGLFRSDPVDPATLNPVPDPLLAGHDALPRITLGRASLTHRFTDMWSGNVFTRYDFTNTELDEIGGYAQYELDCVAFRLTTGYLPAFTRSDGSHRAADYRIALLVWVKALQPDNIDKLRGWGSTASGRTTYAP